MTPAEPTVWALFCLAEGHRCGLRSRGHRELRCRRADRTDGGRGELRAGEGQRLAELLRESARRQRGAIHVPRRPLLR
eukprot:11327993-Alexandrium_andersonii.AAC.1